MELRKSVLLLLLSTVLAPTVLYNDTLGVDSISFPSRKQIVGNFSTSESSNKLEHITNSGGKLGTARQLTGEEGDNDPTDDDASSQANGEAQEAVVETGEENSRESYSKGTSENDAGESGADVSREHKLPYDRVRQLKDQLIRANIYLTLPEMRSNALFIRELRLRVKDVLRVLGEATMDSELHGNAAEKLRAMEKTLRKGKRMHNDCATMVKKLRAMVHLAEEQLKLNKKQLLFLTHLTAKTIPKGVHCLPLCLLNDYFKLNLSQQHFPNKEKLDNPRLYHYALFSDSVLAVAVVVNSTISHAKDPSKHVFHIVTNKLNYAAMRMWFLAYPPGKATIQIQNVDEFTWLNSSRSSAVLSKQGSSMGIDHSHHVESDPNLKYRNPNYISALNYLRFYLPEIFPKLSKVLFLDDDVVVQKDLTGLWSVDSKEKVIGVVETCNKSFHRFDQFLNFSNPQISKNFSPRACGWAFGMNIIDLNKWRKHNLTEVYHKWQNLNRDRLLWKLGTLPPGLVTFWNHTYRLDKSWHVLGLGYNPNVPERDIERAAVIHYNGILKPWLAVGIPKYRAYWAKYVDSDLLYLRECNITP